MWNCELKFSPAEILGMLVLVEDETERALRNQEPVAWVSAPYDQIPPDLLVYESFRLMYTLVTDTQSDVWPNAVEEALLYGLCWSLVEMGRTRQFAAESLQTVNALRLRVGRRPLRSLKNLRQESWEDQVLDRLLFSDRDWQLASPGIIQRPELREVLRIDDTYFGVTYRKPTASELQRAQVIFREIVSRARAGTSADGLELIPPLHQT